MSGGAERQCGRALTLASAGPLPVVRPEERGSREVAARHQGGRAALKAPAAAPARVLNPERRLPVPVLPLLRVQAVRVVFTDKVGDGLRKRQSPIDLTAPTQSRGGFTHIEALGSERVVGESRGREVR